MIKKKDSKQIWPIWADLYVRERETERKRVRKKERAEEEKEKWKQIKKRKSVTHVNIKSNLTHFLLFSFFIFFS